MYFYLIATVAALGGLRLGYDPGVISGALGLAIGTTQAPIPAPKAGTL